MLPNADFLTGRKEPVLRISNERYITAWGVRNFRAAGGGQSGALIEDAKRHAPLYRLTTIEEVGAMAACLVSDFAGLVSGQMTPIDGGPHVV